jgi:transcription termination/antitermination protein NusA
MTDISLNNKNVQYINMASRVTKADIIDCVISGEMLVFIVRKGHMGIAIGRKGKNLEKLRGLFKKSIKFVEYEDDTEKFVENLFKPYKVEKIEMKGDDESPVVRVKVKSSEKAKVIGKAGKNIEVIRKLAQRHQNVKDVQIK